MHGRVLHTSERVRSNFILHGLRFFLGVVSKTNPWKQSVGPFQRNIGPKFAAFRPRILYVFPPS